MYTSSFILIREETTGVWFTCSLSLPSSFIHISFSLFLSLFTLLSLPSTPPIREETTYHDYTLCEYAHAFFTNFSGCQLCCQCPGHFVYWFFK
jgi:hypothetical protein